MYNDTLTWGDVLKYAILILVFCYSMVGAIGSIIALGKHL